jgi:hypothetical protein
MIRVVGLTDSELTLFYSFYEESSLVIKNLVIEIIRVYGF